MQTPYDLAIAHLAAIVTSSSDAIISKSPQGIVQTWNAAAERMFGYAADEIVGRSLRVLIPDDRQHEEDEILERIARGEEISNFETIRLRKDGTPVAVSVTVSPIHDPTGAVIGASKIVRDVTGQAEMLARLRDSEERFRDLADNISQFAWMADRDGYVFWYNKRWYDYTGTTLEEMKGWGWRKVHHPDHVDRVVQSIQRSWDTGEPWEDTFPLRGADGEYRWFLSRAMPIRNESGEIMRWFGSNTDITEQKQREEQISLLMGEVNHRSKNLLGLVLAIARQTADDRESAFLKRFSQRLQALASGQDVLLQRGWRGADVGALVRSQLAHFSDLIDRRITIEGPEVMLTPGASQTLGMVLHELGTNAGKYGALSDDDGQVRVTWRLLGGAAGERRFAMEWIESGGPPVDPPARRGYGSSVIERMAELSLGAEVDFDFLPEGLQWRLTCADGRALEPVLRSAAPAAPAAEPAPPASRQRVLLVEDEAIIGLDLAHTLDQAGYRVIGPASSVSEAMQLLDEYPCEAAILDINLGSETSEAIAERLLEAGTPIITLSGYSEDQKPDVFRGVPHLSKPLASGKLLQMLRAHARTPATTGQS